MKIVYTMLPNRLLTALILLLLAGLTSCVDQRKAIYFNNLPEGTMNGNMVIPEVLIQKHDILNVTVMTPEPANAVNFNVGNNEYIVNNDSTVRLPVLGNVKAAGLTKDQVRDSILKIIRVKKYLVDPVVNVRIVTFHVTVLGEVNGPKVITVPTEKITLLEALGFAGDMTFFAQRDNVLVIREEKGVRTVKRVNLNSTELFTSPYYYLQSNDVVYVEPNKQKLASQNKTKDWVFGILSATSVIIGIATFLKN